MQFPAIYTVNDGSDTPVAVTYSPEDVSPARTIVVDRRAASRAAQPTIEMNFMRPQGQRKTFRVERKHAMPVVRTLNGVDTVVGVNRAFVTFVLDPQSTEQERKHLHAAVVNNESKDEVKANVTILEPIYG